MNSEDERRISVEPKKKDLDGSQQKLLSFNETYANLWNKKIKGCCGKMAILICHC